MSLKASICDNVKQDIVGVVLVGCPIKLADYKFRTAAIFGAAKFLANVDFSEVRKQLKNFDAMVDIEKVDLPTIMIYGKLDELLLLYQKKPELLEKAINDVNSDVDFETIDGMFHNSINLLHKLGVKTSVEKCHKLIADWIEKHAKN
jgi:dienelactone hydrolase